MIANDLLKTSITTWPIYGHAQAVALLQHSLQPAQRHGASNGPHHANLLLGPRQVGKSTLARIFAQGLLCNDPVQRPCGLCRPCQLVQRGSHPDFRLLQPVDKSGAVDRINGMLRVEQAAELIHDAALRAVEGRYKVFLIQDFHKANDAFANKLLKTLEEPPEHVILCLTAVDRSQLLPTINSRCQIIELRPLPPDTIAHALMTTWQASSDQANLLARLANGRLGWAVQQLAEPENQRERLTQIQTLWQMLAANRIERLALAEQLASNRDSQQLFGLLETWLSWWRDLLLAQAGCADQCTNIDQLAEISRQAQLVSMTEIQQHLARLQQIEGYLHHTVNTRLALDVLLLHMPRIRSSTMPLQA